MCGILAIHGNSNGVPDDEVNNAINVISHRGPNDYGVEKLQNAVLAFRRLSILDLTYNGHQPMADASGRYWIVFNGEIYNFLHIRQHLESQGVSFVSSSDTEVILKGYIKYGEKIVEWLDGMFAFVIYDSLAERTFAARDRMGKKPLLYFQCKEYFIFFSELKQITQFSFFNKQVNRKAISLFLNYGSIPSPLTIFEGVYQLEPGHYAYLDKGHLKKTQYWKAEITFNSRYSRSEAIQVTHDLVTESIKKRLISDVPLGAFLSGGVDSSIITAVMATHSKDVKTFSIDYAEAPKAYSESAYADLIVSRYQTEHTSITVSPDDVFSSIEQIIWHMDQPSCDAINTYFVAKAARQGVVVSLSGVGADELFAGYSTFKFAGFLSRFRSPAKNNIGKQSFADRIFYNLPDSLQVDWKVRIAAGILGGFRTNLDRYNLIKHIYRPSEISALFPENEGALVKAGNLETGFQNSYSTIQQITLAELNYYLANTLLRDSDVMGMANSIEIRCPFLDHKLIEFALSLPDDYKINRLSTKVILKEAFKSYLPDQIISRKKMGFAFPLSAWLKTGKLKNLVDDCLSETSVLKRGLFDYKEVQKVKNAYFSLKQDSIQTYQYYQRVWVLVVLELWHRIYID